eukprot:238845_1
MGQYGMWFGKKLLYETDLRIPFFINGPDINPGQITSKTALTIDIAPTIIDLALGYVPDNMDGQSLTPYFNLEDNEEATIYKSRQSFLIEYYGETDIHHDTDEPYGQRVIKCPSHTQTINEISCDLWNNTYQCIRTIDGNDNEVSSDNDNIGEIFCEYTCYDDGYNVVDCISGSTEAKGEYYNLNTDPWQLTNSYDDLSESQISHFQTIMNLHFDCAGHKCQSLRTKTISQQNNRLNQIKKSGNAPGFEPIAIISCSIVIMLCIWAFIYLRYGTMCFCINSKNNKQTIDNYEYSPLRRETRYSA